MQISNQLMHNTFNLEAEDHTGSPTPVSEEQENEATVSTSLLDEHCSV